MCTHENRRKSIRWKIGLHSEILAIATMAAMMVAAAVVAAVLASAITSQQQQKKNSSSSNCSMFERARERSCLKKWNSNSFFRISKINDALSRYKVGLRKFEKKPLFQFSCSIPLLRNPLHGKIMFEKNCDLIYLPGKTKPSQSQTKPPSHSDKCCYSSSFIRSSKKV